MSAVAIILARGGSKRIPRKNIRPFHGLPILSYPIAAARSAGCFEEIMVSTDDPEIAVLAHEYGATVPFLRSAKNSDDYAGSDQAMAEVILKYREQGRYFSLACGIYPTAALATPDHFRMGLKLLEADEGLTAVAPVLKFSFPVQRALKCVGGRFPMMQPEHYDSRSQDLQPAYHDAGQWYWLRTDRFLHTRELLGPNSGGLVLSQMEAQDIDNEDDWAMAELKYEMRLRNTANL